MKRLLAGCLFALAASLATVKLAHGNDPTSSNVVTGRGLSIIHLAVTAGYGSSIGHLEGRLLAINYCKVPGIDCPPKPVTAELQELKLCCSYYDGECSIVEMITDCHPEHEYAVICDWGRTTSSGEIECYD